MSIDDLNNLYPNNESVMQSIFDMRFKEKFCPKCGSETKFYRVKKRQSFACKDCGYQIYPLAGTIFNRTHISLKSWMFVIFLFSKSKHGISAAEISRMIGVSYKTAFKMGHKIRSLMTQPKGKLKGIVEADEAYLGGEMIFIGEKRYWKNKVAMIGAVEQGGRVKSQIIDGSSATTIIPYVNSNIRKGSTLFTDQAAVYRRTKENYKHRTVNHRRHSYSYNGVHTNTIEGFWSHLKRALKGTYHGVSPAHLQKYIDECVFRHNNRVKEVYPVLLELAIACDIIKL